MKDEPETLHDFCAKLIGQLPRSMVQTKVTYYPNPTGIKEQIDKT